MFTLCGFAQVLEILEIRGRLHRFSLRTPEGFILEATLWMVMGLLESPVVGEIFSFAGFCPFEGQVSLTAFRPVAGMDPLSAPPTTTCTTGAITKVEDTSFTLEYLSYNKVTKGTHLVEHTVQLRGDRWERRKSVLQFGTQVQVLGTLDGPSTTDCDDFWLFFRKDPLQSPAKRSISNLFSSPIKPTLYLSDLETGLQGGCSPLSGTPFSSAPSSPILPPVEEEKEVQVVKKGKKPASKRQRRK